MRSDHDQTSLRTPTRHTVTLLTVVKEYCLRVESKRTDLWLEDGSRTNVVGRKWMHWCMPLIGTLTTALMEILCQRMKLKQEDYWRRLLLWKYMNSLQVCDAAKHRWIGTVSRLCVGRTWPIGKSILWSGGHILSTKHTVAQYHGRKGGSVEMERL